MAVGVLGPVVVFDERLYRGNGLVGTWCDRITDRFTREAILHAPERSGELKAGIFGHTEQVGIRQVEGIIESTANHTLFVLRGTTGPIMSDLLWSVGGKLPRGISRREADFFKMHLPPFREHEGKALLTVRGQQPNNFLITAWRITGHDHRAIRGRFPSVGIDIP